MVSQQDIDDFKALVDIVKTNAVVIAQTLVDAGVATWKPGMNPAEPGPCIIVDVKHQECGKPRRTGFGKFASRDAAKKFLDGFINKGLAEGYVIRPADEETL